VTLVIGILKLWVVRVPFFSKSQYFKYVSCREDVF
jgi:hypothetical protein